MENMSMFGVEKKKLVYQWVGASSLHCCVPKCTCSARNKCCMSFHGFPADNEARQQWLAEIRRDNFTPNKNSRVCSRHFLLDDIVLTLRGKRLLRWGAVPVLFEWNNYSLSEPRPGVCEPRPGQEESHAAADPTEDCCESEMEVMAPHHDNCVSSACGIMANELQTENENLRRRLELVLSQKEQQLRTLLCLERFANSHNQTRHHTSLEQTKEPEGSLTWIQPENVGEIQQQIPSFKQCSKGKREQKHESRRAQVNIGVMVPYEGELKPQRGRTFPLSAKLDVNAADLLKQAVRKMKTFTKNLDEGSYVLLYPDCSEIVHLPGTNRPFKLSAYKQLVNKPYQRITFFICQEIHFRGDDDSSDTDCEVGITSGSTAAFSQAPAVIINSVLQGSASSVSRSMFIAPPTTTSQAGNETTRPFYQPKMISSVMQGSASSLSRSIHIAPPTTTSQAGIETTRPCYQPKIQMISSVLQGSASSLSRSIHIAPPTTTSRAGNGITRPCYQPKLCHVSCQTDPVQIFPYDAKVIVLDQDCSAKVADLQDIIHDHNYHSSDPSTKFTPTFSQEIKSEPPTFSQEIKSEIPRFGQVIKLEPPTFGLEVTSEPPAFSQEIKSEPPIFDVEVTAEPPRFGQVIKSEPFDQEIKSEPSAFGVEMKSEPPTFSQEIKSEPPTFGLEIKLEPPAFGVEIKSEPLTFGLEVTAEPPRFSQEIKSEPSTFGIEIPSEPPTLSQEIKTEPPTFGLEIKSEPLTHPISSPIPHSVTAEHAHSPPQEIKSEPSSDAAAHTSHNVLLHMNDTNYVVDTCLTQLNLTTCKECNSRVCGITKVVEGCSVIYKVQYSCSHPELSWSAHPLLGDVKSEL